MAIGNVVQVRDWVHIFDEKGHQTGSVAVGDVANGDGLMGYTSTSVNIRTGDWMRTYDEDGKQISSIQAN